MNLEWSACQKTLIINLIDDTDPSANQFNDPPPAYPPSPPPPPYNSVVLGSIQRFSSTENGSSLFGGNVDETRDVIGETIIPNEQLGQSNITYDTNQEISEEYCLTILLFVRQIPSVKPLPRIKHIYTGYIQNVSGGIMLDSILYIWHGFQQ